MQTKLQLEAVNIWESIRKTPLPDVDVVVGIATGGVVPASLCAFVLDKPLTMMRINYRAEDNKPQYPRPVVYSAPEVSANPKRILLVDDVSVSGQTLQAAKNLLTGHEVTTVVLKGQADIVLLPPIETCVKWPWKTD